MKFIQIDKYGEFLVMRKNNINKDDFYSALNCEETINESLQNSLYRLLCFNGILVDELYKKFIDDYPNKSLDFAQFIAWYFNVDEVIISDFLSEREEGEKCYYIDNVLINGYSENFLISDEYINDDADLLNFQTKLKEALAKL